MDSVSVESEINLITIHPCLISDKLKPSHRFSDCLCCWSELVLVGRNSACVVSHTSSHTVYCHMLLSGIVDLFVGWKDQVNNRMSDLEELNRCLKIYSIDLTTLNLYWAEYLLRYQTERSSSILSSKPQSPCSFLTMVIVISACESPDSMQQEILQYRYLSVWLNRNFIP